MPNFLIAPANKQQSGPGFTAGMQTDLKPWMIPDDAFESLRNAYVFRGRVRKRWGTKPLNTTVNPNVAQYYTRLRMNIGTVDGAGNFTATVPGTVFSVGQMFSVHYPSGQDVSLIVTITGAPSVLISNDPANTFGTFNTTNGLVTITSMPTAVVYWYPSLPVMGLLPYETQNSTFGDSFSNTMAFDTEFAYLWDKTIGGWDSAGLSVWTGTDTNFFWGANVLVVGQPNTLLFIVNDNAADGITYFNGSTFATISPVLDNLAPPSLLQSARMIVSFKGSLLALNTIELPSGGTSTRYINRIRWTGNSASVLDPNAWNVSIPGMGGALDLDTAEAIVSSAIIKDTLIIYCEHSTWTLSYGGSRDFPFISRKINAELGAESTNSMVLFDRAAIGVGDVGIHACNGVNVERIDSKIPSVVFEIANVNAGPDRVYGIRDYFNELTYWAYPDESNQFVYPRRVLVYNYKTLSWAFFDDSITSFGYFQLQQSYSWQNRQVPWNTSFMSWEDAADSNLFKSVIAGNQQGFTFVVDADTTRNSLSLQITDITLSGNLYIIECINHNLAVGDWVAIENCSGISLVSVIYQVELVTSKDFFYISSEGSTGTYTGGGTVAKVSKIDIYTKQYNFFAPQNLRFSTSLVRFLVDKTPAKILDGILYGGQLAVDALPGAGEVSLRDEGFDNGSISGTMTLDTFAYPIIALEATQERFWHRVYMLAEGEVVQLHIYMDDFSFLDPIAAFADFQMHAMMFTAAPTGPL